MYNCKDTINMFRNRYLELGTVQDNGDPNSGDDILRVCESYDPKNQA